MSRVAMLLLLAVVVSALYLVRTAYESRRTFAQIERTRADARRLDQEYARLDAELRLQSNTEVVERQARSRLKMSPPDPGLVHYVATPEGVAPSAAAGPGSDAIGSASSASARPAPQRGLAVLGASIGASFNAARSAASAAAQEAQ